MKRACLNVSGWGTCPHYQQAKIALQGISTILPAQFTVEITERKNDLFVRKIIISRYYAE
jgi:hypothetical protein